MALHEGGLFVPAPKKVVLTELDLRYLHRIAEKRNGHRREYQASQSKWKN